MPTRPAFHRSPMQHLLDAQRRELTNLRYGTDWKKARRVHLQNNPLCFKCGKIATIVDHIVPVEVDPTRRLDPTNHRSCCVDCHASITGRFKATGVNEPRDPRGGQR